MQVLFIDSVHPILWEKLSKAGFTCIDGIGKSADELKPLLKTADGLVIRSRFTIDQALLKECPQLKFIARSGSGMENIDTEAALALGIKLYNSPEGNCDAVGEHAVGMILSLFNHLCRGNQEAKKGVWIREGNRGLELGGRCVGIIGYGHTGSAFAQKLSGFGCRILAYDKYKTGFGNEHVTEVSLPELMDEAEIISFHLPLNSETKEYCNADFISKLNLPFYIINTSRGVVVKTADLVNGLKSGKVLGACLDVLEYEKSSFESLEFSDLPEDFQYLAKSENVILSPHVAGWTSESYLKLSLFLAQKILADFRAK